MKVIIHALGAIVFFLISGLSLADTLPSFYSDIGILEIESWPNASNPTYSYMVRMDKSLSATGCSSPNVFSVKAGDYHEQSLSILLAAMMSVKKVKIRVVECTDRPIVDRVAIINN